MIFIFLLVVKPTLFFNLLKTFSLIKNVKIFPIVNLFVISGI